MYFLEVVLFLLFVIFPSCSGHFCFLCTLCSFTGSVIKVLCKFFQSSSFIKIEQCFQHVTAQGFSILFAGSCFDISPFLVFSVYALPLLYLRTLRFFCQFVGSDFLFLLDGDRGVANLAYVPSSEMFFLFNPSDRL